MTPTLQSEFLSVAWNLIIEDIPLRLERTANANQILAVWMTNGEAQQLVVPARRPNGVVLPDSEVEVISDLLFHFAGFKPPACAEAEIKEVCELIAGHLPVRVMWKRRISNSERAAGITQ